MQSMLTVAFSWHSEGKMIDDIHEQETEMQVTVLVVEDSETQAKHLANILASASYQVRIAENGRKGLEAARAQKPTLIISDISMPEMDGFTLCQEVKRDPSLHDVPVILLTALTSLYDVLKALDCGADNFIRKPYEKKYLLGRIRHILANRSVRSRERVQVGMQINLGGQTHFITAERQQIFDLLISTYEEAVQMTTELREQQEEIARSYESLEGLYRIVDALNPAIKERSVLDSALERALDLPGVIGSCIMLLDQQGNFSSSVSENFFPPGQDGATCADCSCHHRLRAGNFTAPAVMEDCTLIKRTLQDGSLWGMQLGLPLVIGDKALGIMHLRLNHDAAISGETMQLFDTVAKQIAIALERACLYSNMEMLVKERTDALEVERNLLSGVVHTAGALVMLVDPEGRIVMFNPACEKSLGWKQEEVRNRFYWEVLLPAKSWEPRKNFFADTEHGQAPAQIADEYVARDGSKRHIIWTTSHVQRADKSIEYFLGSGVDVTDLRSAEEKLQFLKNFDSVTGLPNRIFMMTRMKILQEMGFSKKRMMGFLSVSFARLLPVRESLGTKGELTVIVEAANRLKNWAKREDNVARLSDHVFAVAIVRSDVNEISAAAREILALLDDPFQVENEELHLEARGGITVFPNDGNDIDTLIEYAQTAMQRALVSTTERYEFYTPTMNQQANERLQLENALRNALKRNEFSLHYQPQLDLKTGEINGMEALIRWSHPTLGMVPPGRFISLAEEIGLITPIGDWVLKTACAQAREWQKAGLNGFRMAVNLSARQFMQKDLVQNIAAVLQEVGLPPEYLDIELTESLIMQDVQHAVTVLNKLRQLDVKISIDDFGTGYSSLAYLKRFPIDVLKIDRSFVCEIPSNPNDAAIASAIISMAHSLGLQVIAEGVETEAQCQFLSDRACDMMQGFLFSKPLPAEQMETLLREKRSLPRHLLRRKTAALHVSVVE
jgi:PAS domain S-box-containing protein/diguanylate cyclase (GGDEF)-like protein